MPLLMAVTPAAAAAAAISARVLDIFDLRWRRKLGECLGRAHATEDGPCIAKCATVLVERAQGGGGGRTEERRNE